MFSSSAFASSFSNVRFFFSEWFQLLDVELCRTGNNVQTLGEDPISDLFGQSTIVSAFWGRLPRSSYLPKPGEWTFVSLRPKKRGHVNPTRQFSESHHDPLPSDSIRTSFRPHFLRGSATGDRSGFTVHVRCRYCCVWKRSLFGGNQRESQVSALSLPGRKVEAGQKQFDHKNILSPWRFRL